MDGVLYIQRRSYCRGRFGEQAVRNGVNEVKSVVTERAQNGHGAPECQQVCGYSAVQSLHLSLLPEVMPR